MAALHATPAWAHLPAWLRWLAAIALASLLALCSDAAAQVRPARSALIVGISNYAAPEVPRLAGVPFDIDSARAMAAGMGITPAQTTVLRDAQATKAAILDALETLASSVAEGSRVFIYFSGHGTRWYEPALQGCKEGLLAYDRETLTNEEIAQRTRRIGALADKVVVMFDACHSDGVSGRRTRAIVPGLTAKFHLRSGADAQACSRPSNLATRALLAESTRLGALRENFVQITSSRADEVSFDEAGKGGLATQGVRDCLLGGATDRDASGAVSMAEIERCAQAIVESKVRPHAELRPHHVTVTGNRNIVPVPAAVVPVAPPALSPAAAPVPVPAPTASPAPPPAAVPALASLATLRDIEAQRNPRRQIEVTLKPSTLRIGKDSLQLTVKPSHDGHLYLVLLGSDRKSFYLLFPNGLDRDNAVRADTRITLPRPGWDLVARGPAGTDHLLVLVSDTPRDLAALSATAPDPASPFTRSLTDLPGRSALIDFFTGRGLTGSSETFGARIVSIQEVDSGARPQMLVTESEAAASRAAQEPPAIRAAPTPGAPRINVLAPDLGGPISSPTRIQLRFEPTAPAAIRPESFRVRYGSLRLDITARVTAASKVAPDGIDVAEAELPKGAHRLLLEIQDSQGRTGERLLQFVVQ